MPKLVIKKIKPKYMCYKCGKEAQYIFTTTFEKSKIKCSMCLDCLIKMCKKSIARTEKRSKNE